VAEKPKVAKKKKKNNNNQIPSHLAIIDSKFIEASRVLYCRV
jgi:hypothetical protein